MSATATILASWRLRRSRSATASRRGAGVSGRGRGGPIGGERVAAASARHLHERVRPRRCRGGAFLQARAGDIVVFHDELELPPGKVRVKVGGGIAGHNGLRSITAHIGNDYRRVRIGIGHPGDKDLVDVTCCRISPRANAPGSRPCRRVDVLLAAQRALGHDRDRLRPDRRHRAHARGARGAELLLLAHLPDPAHGAPHRAPGGAAHDGHADPDGRRLRCGQAHLPADGGDRPAAPRARLAARSASCSTPSGWSSTNRSGFTPISACSASQWTR